MDESATSKVGFEASQLGSALLMGQGLEWAGRERGRQEGARWGSASLLDSGRPHSSPALKPGSFLDLISLTEN